MCAAGKPLHAWGPAKEADGHASDRHVDAHVDVCSNEYCLRAASPRPQVHVISIRLAAQGVSVKPFGINMTFAKCPPPGAPAAFRSCSTRCSAVAHASCRAHQAPHSSSVDASGSQTAQIFGRRHLLACAPAAVALLTAGGAAAAMQPSAKETVDAESEYIQGSTSDPVLVVWHRGAEHTLLLRRPIKGSICCLPASRAAALRKARLQGC